MKTRQIIAGLTSVTAVAAVAVAGTGFAGAATPSRGPVQVEMTIVNLSPFAEHLARADPGGGSWVRAPMPTLLPDEAQVVIAQTNSSAQAVHIDYVLEGPLRTHAAYALNASARGADTASTGVSDASRHLRSTSRTEYPSAWAEYTLF